MSHLAEHHRLMLTAIFGSDDAARSSLNSWAQTVDIDYVDRVTFTFLPQLYLRAVALQFHDAPFSQLGNVYKQAFYRNNIMLRRARDIVGQLKSHEVEPIVLGDAVAAAEWYPDPGARRIDVLQMLVRPDEHSAASKLLSQRSEVTAAKRHPVWAEALQNVDSFRWDELRVDVLQHAAIYAFDPGLDATVRRQATFSSANDVDWITPLPTHQMLLTLLENRFQGQQPSLQWLGDALTMLQRDRELSWEALVEMAIRYNLTTAVRNRITLLDSIVTGCVPTSVIERLRNVRPSAHEEREFALRYHPTRRFNAMKWHYHHYRLRYADTISPAQYVRGALGGSLLSLPGKVARKTVGGFSEAPHKDA